MPRAKNYTESAVIEKAMNLFWRNGYETTSMQMLEKEMGINKFSIYASFGNKNGVFIESLKCYKQKLNRLITKLSSSSKGAAGIKEYFYDFIEFSSDTEFGKGCLITNTANEIGQEANEQIKDMLADFTENVRKAFEMVLKQDKTKDRITVEQQADYLLISMFGLSSATRVFNKKQLDNYVSNVLKNV